MFQLSRTLGKVLFLFCRFFGFATFFVLAALAFRTFAVLAGTLVRFSFGAFGGTFLRARAIMVGKSRVAC